MSNKLLNKLLDYLKESQFLQMENTGKAQEDLQLASLLSYTDGKASVILVHSLKMAKDLQIEHERLLTSLLILYKDGYITKPFEESAASTNTLTRITPKGLKFIKEGGYCLIAANPGNEL